MLARAKEQGRAFEVQGVLDDWMHILRPCRMQELVQELKSHGYCVYYLSNIPDVLGLSVYFKPLKQASGSYQSRDGNLEFTLDGRR